MHRFFHSARRSCQCGFRRFSRAALRLLLAAAILPAAALPAAAMPYMSVDLTGRILAQNQAFDRWYPASLTKMMTAYVTFQALQAGKIRLDTVINLSPQAAKVVPSRSGWRPGSTLTLDTALTVMLVKSANDMANAIAEAVGGSQADFVALMNAQAQRLGMSGTHYANPSGLPNPDNYSDARDIAVLAVQMRRDFPQYSHYFAIPAIDFGKGKPVPNSNNLIGRYTGADGMKTGFICASGFNLVASATRSGRTIIAVVLGADRVDIREETAANLLSQGFKTQGSPQLTLASLRPYGDNQQQPANLYNEICNAQAGKARLQHRDKKGHVIFDSPLIAARNEHPAAVAVQPVFEPQPAPAPAKAKAKAKTKAGAKAKAGTKKPRAKTAKKAKAAPAKPAVKEARPEKAGPAAEQPQRQNSAIPEPQSRPAEAQ